MALDKRFECPDCGKLVMKIWDHGCPGAAKVEERHLAPKEQQILHQALRKSVKIIEEPKPPPTVRPSAVSGLMVKRKEKSSTERNRRWREANREKAREYQRNYMRKWRAQPDDGAR